MLVILKLPDHPGNWCIATLAPSLLLQGSHAYHLCLPHSLSRLHPVFPVVKRTPAPQDPFGHHNKPPPPPEIIDDEEHYEVEKILDSQLYHGKLQYLVKWKGFGYEENSWADENNVLTGL